jgi:predicted signal transduction protein with EAL and GGDEF domain
MPVEIPHPSGRVPAPPYRECLDELRQILESEGSLGLLLIDVSQLAQVEHDYGSRAFAQVLGRATDVVKELRGTEVRSSDVLALSDKGGDAFLVFLSPRRYNSHLRISDLRAAAGRVEALLNRKLARLTSPYLRGTQEVRVGFSLVLFNPLVVAERLIARVVDEAWECVRLQRLQRRFQDRSQLQEMLMEDRLVTVFQPIVHLREPKTLGYEALSRGPAGSPYPAPASLFAVASELDLVFELDRACRRRALLAARELPPDAKLFLNVYPSCMYDPIFQGANLIRWLEGLGLGPSASSWRSPRGTPSRTTPSSSRRSTASPRWASRSLWTISGRATQAWRRSRI